MTYLDHGATSMNKPQGVMEAVRCAMENCANPGRSGHAPAMTAAQTVLRCRERAGEMFGCKPEQVVFTGNCTQGLNMAIRTLVRYGDKVAISGFEHNAVVRPLHELGTKIQVAGQKLFDRADTLERFEDALRGGVKAAVFTHVSNVFGYILPVEEMAELCRKYAVPFVIDAAQSAGMLPVKLDVLGADFIAIPGHKGLLGPQGTGMLLCGKIPTPLIYGGTGSDSRNPRMPEELPERAEAGTLNVPGIAGLSAGMAWLEHIGIDTVFARQQRQMKRCADGLERLGFRVFRGEDQAGTVSFVPHCDCEIAAHHLAEKGVAVRAGLHCAPLAHESAGSLKSGTVRVSFGHDAAPWQTGNLLLALASLSK